MNAHDILDMIGDAKGTYVWDAQQVRSGNIKPSGKKLVSKKLWLIAAIIALILLLVGCAIVYVLSLQDMKIGEYSVTEPEHYGPNWVVIEAKEKTYEVLSVQGFADNPNQQAVKEYRDYLDSINRDTVTDEEKTAKRLEIAEKNSKSECGKHISKYKDRHSYDACVTDLMHFSNDRFLCRKLRADRTREVIESGKSVQIRGYRAGNTARAGAS